MGESAGSDLAWSVEPVDSRLVRACLYLAEGLLGGVVAATLVGFGRNLLPAPVTGSLALVGLLALLAVMVLGWLWLAAFERLAGDTHWWNHEWQDWRWPILFTAAIGWVLVALDPDGPPTPLGEHETLWIVLWLGAVALASVGAFLQTVGEVDPDELSLSVRRYRRCRTLDLRLVTGVRRATLGPWTLLWLSVVPGAEKRATHQGFYVVPTRTVERAWPAFEAGLATDPPVSGEAAERGQFLRRVNRVVGVVVLAVVLGVVVFLGAVVGLTWQAFGLVWWLAAAVAFLLKFGL